MRALLRYIFLAGLACLMVSPAFATINFPALSALGGTYLTQAQTYDSNFTQMAKSFSTYFGQAAGFAHYLSGPIGKDNLGKFPSLYVGIGVGAAIGNGAQMKSEISSSISGSVPSYIGDPAISFNFGIGFTRQIDLRISFFPGAAISLPSISGGYSGSVAVGLYKARLGYNIIESSLFKPGVTIAGFASYATTSITATAPNQSFSQTDSSGTQTTLATTSLSASIAGQYLGVGPEIRAWYDMKFFHPFVGYSLGLQMGQMTTGVNIQGQITVTPSAALQAAGLGVQTDTGSLIVSERVASKLYTHRLLFGFEISLFVLDIGVEAQVDLVNGLLGAAVGTGFRF